MDPFEVLGVSRDATAAQVEARWRLLARRLHPDQHPGADEAERARLTAAMAELNGARQAVLTVLQRPDAGPAPGGPAAEGSAAGRPGAATSGAVRTADAMPAPPGAVGFLLAAVVGALLLVGLAVVVVVLVTAQDQPTATTAAVPDLSITPPAGPATTLFVEWAIGACISDGEFVVPVDCGAPNAGRIVLRTTAPEFCPDWAEAFVRVDVDVWCVDERA